MSLSLSLSNWHPSSQKVSPAEGPRYGIDPEVLVASGILRNPNLPDQAYHRARSLIEQGRYREGRAVLHPHVRTAPVALRPGIIDLLARCTMHGGGDWKTQLGEALEAHQCVGNAMDVARTHQRLGEMHALAGDFTRADRHLRDAGARFLRLGDVGRGTQVECARARLRLRAGMVERALERIDRALRAVGGLDPRTEALARLDRARIVAARGDSAEAAREMVAAERVLGVSGNAADRLQLRLVRAETLLLAHQPERAAEGIKRILVEATSTEDVATRAWLHQLYGTALLDQDPGQARRHLMRAHHLYESIGAEHQLAACEIQLARADHRLGLNPAGRLKAIAAREMNEWPLLRAELAIAKAEIFGRDYPERAREQLFLARAFAAENGHQRLLEAIDRTIMEQRLAHDEELDELTPIDHSQLVPVVEVGHGVATGPAPEPFAETTDSVCRVVELPAKPWVVRQPAHDTSTALRPPRAVGVSQGKRITPMAAFANSRS